MKAIVFPPAEFIYDELIARGIGPQRGYEALGIFVSDYLDIMVGHCVMSPGIADKLAAYFGTSADLWMNLDAAYQSARKERK